MATVRIFISHKKEDAATAETIAGVLRVTDVEVYLDTLDPHLSANGDDLAAYLQTEIGRCTHLLAIVSRITKESWWVPFEIGIATEKQRAISTFAVDMVTLPSYLKKWPYLTRIPDVVTYLKTALGLSSTSLGKSLLSEASTAERRNYSRAFHSRLKQALGQ